MLSITYTDVGMATRERLRAELAAIGREHERAVELVVMIRHELPVTLAVELAQIIHERLVDEAMRAGVLAGAEVVADPVERSVRYVRPARST